MHHACLTLDQQGYWSTPQRNPVREDLPDAGCHTSAEELARRVRRAHPNVSISTVYGELEVLMNPDLMVEARRAESVCSCGVPLEPPPTMSSGNAAVWTTSVTGSSPPCTRSSVQRQGVANWPAGQASRAMRECGAGGESVDRPAVADWSMATTANGTFCVAGGSAEPAGRRTDRG